MPNPRLNFPRTFRTIREQPNTKGNPTTTFIRIMYPQDTPHNCIHAHQMAFQNYPYREKNLNAANRRVHANTQIVATCIAIVGKLDFLCLRLPFGTAY